MKRDTKAFGSFRMDDLARAREFAAEALGLRVSEVPGWTVVRTLRSSRSRRSPLRGPSIEA
jgi:hypothetical protein